MRQLDGADADGPCFWPRRSSAAICEDPWSLSERGAASFPCVPNQRPLHTHERRLWPALWINGGSQTTLHPHLFALPHLASHLDSLGEESPQSVSDSPAVAPPPMPKETRDSACAHAFAWPFVQSLAHVQEGFLAFLCDIMSEEMTTYAASSSPDQSWGCFPFRLSSFSSSFPGALLGTVASPCCQRRKVGFRPWTRHQCITEPHRDKQPFTFTGINVKLMHLIQCALSLQGRRKQRRYNDNVKNWLWANQTHTTVPL